MNIWTPISKSDPRTLPLADRHYTRQTIGSRLWTRPGYNFVLLAEYPEGMGLWCWWRPKWEDGRPGTERKDRLRVLECTMFRREGKTDLASVMIEQAVQTLNTESAAAALHLHNAGPIAHLITGVSSQKTTKQRSNKSLPGMCYIHAGWTLWQRKTSAKADTWLYTSWNNPLSPIEETSQPPTPSR